MTELDHLAVIAPDLATGVAWVRDVLGVEPPRGGSHPQMGTHNHLLRLGDGVFLEVIAVDPDAPQPAHRRWFGLDDRAAVERHWHAGRHLRAYVARCTGVADTIGARGSTFGAPMRLTRGDRGWTFGVRPDGELPAGGALPHLMDWGERGTPAPTMQDFGLTLRELVVETPDPDAVHAALDAIGLAAKPAIRRADAVRLSAAIDTPQGVRTLT
ncbi:MAG: VOC family protein [Hyphomicrobiaceae bacterium]|nr:MAG: VOC family protein [Hyphomicrobiaceae bacterium]